MANEIIRPTQLPARADPVASEVVPSDNGATVGGVTWADGVNAAVPPASQPEAEAGVINTKRMTPLTTKQAIDAQVPPKISSAIAGLNLGSAAQAQVSDFATAAQGALADTAVQPSRTVSAGSGLTGGGTLAANRTISLNSASIASLAKADTSVQTVNGNAPDGAGNVAVDAEFTQEQNSVATAISESFAPTVEWVRTAGYAVAGDGGGALYKRATSEPPHAGKFMSADGAWWELAEKAVTPEMFGARGDDSSFNDGPALRAALSAQLLTGAEIRLLGKTYHVNDQDPALATTMLCYNSPGASLRIVGAGRDKSRIKMGTSQTAQLLYGKNLSSVHLSGFVLDCEGQTGGGGLDLIDCDNIYIDIETENAFNNGMLFDSDATGCNNIELHKPINRNCGGHGIAVSDDGTEGPGARCRNIIIYKPETYNPGNSGVNLSNPLNATVIDPLCIHDGYLYGNRHQSGYAGVRCTNSFDSVTIISPRSIGMSRGLFFGKGRRHKVIGGQDELSGMQSIINAEKISGDTTTGSNDGYFCGYTGINPCQLQEGGNESDGVTISASVGNTFQGVVIISTDGKMVNGFKEVNNSGNNFFPMTRATGFSGSEHVLLSANRLSTGGDLVRIGNKGNSHLEVGSGAAPSTVMNRLQVHGVVSGLAPVISALGSDANIDLRLVPKGSGTVRITSLPTSSAGLPSGSLWRDGNIVNIVP